MNVTRMKIVGAALGLVAFGGALGAVFTGYGSFAGAASPQYVNTQAAVTTAAASTDEAKPANATTEGDATLPSKEEMQRYAELFEQRFAAELGVDQARLNAALQATIGSTIDQAVQDGNLDAAQADIVKTKIGGMTFSDLISMPMGFVSEAKNNGLGDNQAFLDATNAAFDAGAQLLGVTRQEFEQHLHDGGLKTLAEARNVTVDTLRSAIAGTLRTELDKAVANGKLTQEQADLAYDAFTGKLEFILTGTMPANKGETNK